MLSFGCTATVKPVALGDTPLPSSEELSVSSSEKNRLKELPVDTLIQNGYEALAKGNQQMAQIHFLMAAEKDPASAAAFTGLGQTWQMSGNSTSARSAFNKALQLDPEHLPALLGLGRLNRDEGNFDAAFENLSKAMALQPENSVVLTELATTYDLSGKEKLAEPLYLKVVELKPSSPAYNNLGFNYMLQGRYPEAVSALQKSLSLDAKNQRARNNLASAYALNGNEPEALELFESVVGKAPAYNNLGYIYMTQGEWDKAEQAFRKALDLNPRFYMRAQENLERLQRIRNPFSP